jgi:uncharacterized protein (DUF4415 family)
MAEYNKETVTPLLRRRAHLREVGADLAKLAEIEHMLRMAGYPVDDESQLDDKRVQQEKPGRADEEARKVAPMERKESPRVTAEAPATEAPRRGRPRKDSDAEEK